MIGLLETIGIAVVGGAIGGAAVGIAVFLGKVVMYELL